MADKYVDQADDKRRFNHTGQFIEVAGLGVPVEQCEVIRMERVELTHTHSGLEIVQPYPNIILLTRGDVQILLERDHINAMIELLTEIRNGG